MRAFEKKKSTVHFFTLNVIRRRRLLYPVTEYCRRTCSRFFEMQIAGVPGGGEGEGVGMREKQAVYYYNFLLF